MKLTEEIKEILSNDGDKLENYSKLNNNKQAVLIAVKQSGWALEYASDKLKINSQI